MDLADRLLYLAEHYRMPLYKLSIACSLSHATLGMAMRRSRAKPSATLDASTARLVADKTGCSLDWLLFGRGNPGELRPL